MNKSRTTLETSQAISAVVEVETEKYHTCHPGGPWDILCKIENVYYSQYPAYPLSEALLAIEELGKVRGWKEKHHFTRMVAYGEREEYWFNDECKNDEPEWKAKAFYLFEAWQQDGGRMDGEKVSEYLLDLFKE